MSYEPDDDVKAKKNVTLTTEVIPFYLEKFDTIAQENDGHLALGRVSLPLAIAMPIELIRVTHWHPSLMITIRFRPRTTAHMGRRLLCRYFGLPQLYDAHRLGRKVSELEADRRDGDRLGADQDLAGEETTNRCLSGARHRPTNYILLFH